MHRFSTNFDSPLADFTSFVLRFGWEGPLALAIGFARHGVVLILVGTALTAVEVLIGGPLARAAWRRLMQGAHGGAR